MSTLPGPSENTLSSQLNETPNEGKLSYKESLKKAETNKEDESLKIKTPIPQMQLPDESNDTLPDLTSSGKSAIDYVRSWGTPTEERVPLLPIHRSPQSPPSDSPDIPQDSTILDSILTFIWKYILTDNMRAFITSHKWFFILLAAAVLIAIGVLLYTTGNLGLLLIYAKGILCSLAGLLDAPAFVFCHH